jgi:hypothetical protein
MKRQRFFFEKKKQKTFDLGARGRHAHGLTEQTFFAPLFFKKAATFPLA